LGRSEFRFVLVLVVVLVLEAVLPWMNELPTVSLRTRSMYRSRENQIDDEDGDEYEYEVDLAGHLFGSFFIERLTAYLGLLHGPYLDHRRT